MHAKESVRHVDIQSFLIQGGQVLLYGRSCCLVGPKMFDSSVKLRMRP